MATNLTSEQVVERLKALCEFVAGYPLSDYVRERMTFREVDAVIKAKRDEIGLTPDDWMAYYENPDVADWLQELGMTRDIRGLIVADHFYDFPLNFEQMPQYDAVCKAVSEFFQSQPLGWVNTAPLAGIVRRYRPEA